MTARSSRSRIVVGGVTPTPVAVDSPEDIASAIVDPLSDTYASGEFRVHLATVLAKRALETAAERA